ncbi:hypothetical protein ACTQZS_03780 [Bilifractor sp. LCP19S3_H10]|uniref:hypothetical protein n=1 Tax=Bilifractor sp. LCP19S3_H10 TaxID=3438736 RepID=UPI003F90B813
MANKKAPTTSRYDRQCELEHFLLKKLPGCGFHHPMRGDAQMTVSENTARPVHQQLCPFA